MRIMEIATLNWSAGLDWTGDGIEWSGIGLMMWEGIRVAID